MVLLRILRVRGLSMEPHFHHGDYVVISGLGKPRCGDVVVFRQPGYGMMIKRLTNVDQEGGLIVSGEVPWSVDSRVFGPVAPQNLIGRVIWHIQPKM